MRIAGLCQRKAAVFRSDPGHTAVGNIASDYRPIKMFGFQQHHAKGFGFIGRGKAEHLTSPVLIPEFRIAEIFFEADPRR